MSIKPSDAFASTPQLATVLAMDHAKCQPVAHSVVSPLTIFPNLISSSALILWLEVEHRFAALEVYWHRYVVMND